MHYSIRFQTSLGDGHPKYLYPSTMPFIFPFENLNRHEPLSVRPWELFHAETG